MSVAQPQPTTSNIPDLVKIGSIPSDTAIDVETSILEPVSFSQGRCRFVLENKGILHSNSRLTFSVSSTQAQALGTNGHLPTGVGIHSLIQRCNLSIGGKTISEIEDFNHWMGYESIFIPNEVNKEREQLLNGRINNLAPVFTPRNDVYQNASNQASNSESVIDAELVQIENGRDFDYGGNASTAVVFRTAAMDVDRQVYDYQKEVNGGIFSILLADLFPFLKMNQLPLFMLREQVAINLTFQPQQAAPAVDGSQRICISSGGVAADVTITQNDVKMIADYIYYPQELMLQYEAANKHMNFTYVDYQFVKRTTSIADFTGGLIQNLGGAGRIVNKVVVACEQPAAGVLGDLLNNYSAAGPNVTVNTNGTVTTNLRYNDLFLFPIDVTNSARHFHNVFITEGRVPMVSRDQYSGQGLLVSQVAAGDPKYEGFGSNELQSLFFYTAYRLNRGERVNSRGIELYDTRATMVGATTFRAWLQVVRSVTLENGVVSVTYA